MRYRYLYVPFALLGLAEPSCVGGQTGDTTGIYASSDGTSNPTGSLPDNMGAGAPTGSNDDLGGDGDVNFGSGGTTATPGIPANGSEAGSGGVGGGAGGEGSGGGSAGEGGDSNSAADAGSIHDNALATGTQEHCNAARVDDAGSADDAGTNDASSNFAVSPNCH